MVGSTRDNGVLLGGKYEDLLYIRQALNELRGIADRHRAQMLCYLIDMAYQETSEMVQEEQKKSMQYT